MSQTSRVYTFFSVHERLFLPVHRMLRDRYGVDAFAGTVWGHDQASFLADGDIDYDPLLVFTRDVLEPSQDAVPDLDFLRNREERYGISVHRMIWLERHLLERRSYEQVLALTEQAFRVVEDAFERFEPSFLFSEDVGCLMSYVHYAVAKGLGIPFWRIGSARMKGLLSVYNAGPQEWNLTKDKLAEIRERGLGTQEREKPPRPSSKASVTAPNAPLACGRGTACRSPTWATSNVWRSTANGIGPIETTPRSPHRQAPFDSAPCDSHAIEHRRHSTTSIVRLPENGTFSTPFTSSPKRRRSSRPRTTSIKRPS